jgi:hypothetical protein
MTSSSLSLKRPLDAALVTLLADIDLVCLILKSVQ